MTPVSLHVHRWGAGERRLLLIHGITSAGSGWWRVGRDLADRGWAVFAPDLRGHGESPMGDSFAFEAYAEDVRALGSGWHAVIAHSMGGAVAVLAAAGDDAWTRRLVLQDPALVVATDVEDILAWLMADFDGPMTPEWMLEQNPRYHPEDARLKALSIRQTMPEVVERTVGDNRPWNVLDAAGRIGVPTVVLGSDPAEGGVVPVTIGEWLATDHESFTYVKLEGAGHSAHRERAGYENYFNALVSALGPEPEETR